MKKVFALNNESIEYQLLAQVLVESANANGVRDLYCVYDGPFDRFASWLQDHNVTVLSCGGLLNREITENYRGNKSLSHARGAYLRLELPVVLAANSIRDTWVLYLDVDTMFMPKFVDPKVHPELVAGAPDFRKDNLGFINTGVLVLNLAGLHSAHPEFLRFIRSRDFDFESTKMGPCDQGAWNSFFGRHFERLAPEYNWKPFWGLNEDAQIVHFVGPNPFEAGQHLAGNRANRENHWSETHRRCVGKDNLAYYVFLSRWYSLAQTILDDQPTEIQHRIQELGNHLRSFGEHHI